MHPVRMDAFGCKTPGSYPASSNTRAQLHPRLSWLLQQAEEQAPILSSLSSSPQSQRGCGHWLPQRVVGLGQAPQDPVVPQQHDAGSVQPLEWGCRLWGDAWSPLWLRWGLRPGTVAASLQEGHALQRRRLFFNATLPLEPGLLCLGAARGEGLLSCRGQVSLYAAVGGEHGETGLLAALAVRNDVLDLKVVQVLA